MQLCGKHISATVNQHATTEEAVFSVDLFRGYMTRPTAFSSPECSAAEGSVVEC
jgi:hypothetical protein